MKQLLVITVQLGVRLYLLIIFAIEQIDGQFCHPQPDHRKLLVRRQARVDLFELEKAEQKRHRQPLEHQCDKDDDKGNKQYQIPVGKASPEGSVRVSHSAAASDTTPRIPAQPAINTIAKRRPGLALADTLCSDSAGYKRSGKPVRSG